MIEKCPHLNNNICKIASSLIGEEVKTYESSCAACTNNKPYRTKNKVTAGLAIFHLKSTGNKIPKELITLAVPPPIHGPGTELAKLIEWFVWESPTKKCNRCKNRIEKMNRWGPDECKRRMPTIVRWLQWSALKRDIPFSKRLVTILINKAIRNSERQIDAMVSSSNNSP